MGGAAKAITSIFKAPVKLFKAVTKNLSGKTTMAKQQLISQAPALVDKNRRRTTPLLGGGASSTLMSGASGVTDEAKKARTTLGA